MKKLVLLCSILLFTSCDKGCDETALTEKLNAALSNCGNNAACQAEAYKQYQIKLNNCN